MDMTTKATVEIDGHTFEVTNLTLVYDNERNAVSYRRVVIGVVIGIAALAAAAFMIFAGSAIAYIP